jgi:GNAT superfamily N-acetyltransferase
LQTGQLAVTIRPATFADLKPLASVLARAFESDPAFTWMLPRADSRQSRSRGVFATKLRAEALPYGAVEVAIGEGRIAGGTIWLPPGHWAPTTSEQLRSLPGYLLAFGGRFGSAAALLQSLARAHPSEPHWYLFAIGVDPTLHGRGIAGLLLRSRLERCDSSHEPAYLEASNPTGIPRYQHFGFEPRMVPSLPDGAPPITPMWRPPGAGPTESGPGARPRSIP